MPTQSAFGLRAVGFWIWFAVWYLAGEWLNLLFAGFACCFMGICHMPEKIVGINLSPGEYALVSEEP